MNNIKAVLLHDFYCLSKLLKPTYSGHCQSSVTGTSCVPVLYEYEKRCL